MSWSLRRTTSPTFATVAIQQSAGAAGAFECAGRAGRLPVLAIPGARQPRGQRCIAATATPPPHGRRQQCRRQPPHPAAAASCRQHCSDSSLLPRRRRGHECHRHVPRVPPPSASPWPLPPPGGRERGSICVYEVCVWRLSLPLAETQVFRIANALIAAGHLQGLPGRVAAQISRCARLRASSRCARLRRRARAAGVRTPHLLGARSAVCRALPTTLALPQPQPKLGPVPYAVGRP